MERSGKSESTFMRIQTIEINNYNAVFGGLRINLGGKSLIHGEIMIITMSDAHS